MKMVRQPGDLDYDEYETLPSSSVSTHMTAGAIAGIMEHCVMYPLDSVKVRVDDFRIFLIKYTLRFSWYVSFH